MAPPLSGAPGVAIPGSSFIPGYLGGLTGPEHYYGFATDTALFFDLTAVASPSSFCSDVAWFFDQYASASVARSNQAGYVSILTFAVGPPTIDGTAVQTQATFLAAASGVPPSGWLPMDPGAITMSFLGGGSELTTWTYGIDPEIQRTSQGAYYALLNTAAPGRWRFKWQGTDPCACLGFGGFSVEAPPL